MIVYLNPELLFDRRPGLNSGTGRLIIFFRPGGIITKFLITI